MEIKVQLESNDHRLELFGPADQHLRLIKSALDVQLSARGSEIIITGEKSEIAKCEEIIDSMQRRLIERGKLDEHDIKSFIEQAGAGVELGGGKAITVYSKKGLIEPFTKGQLDYVEKMLGNDLTFCIGPAGTGKTYLAVAVAVSMLKKKQIRKIVLARPAVEAGERLGFLPGDLREKVNPYLRPLFDSLEDMMDFGQMGRFMERDIIEVVPLAFMRGRTLNEACIICDEAQNTVPSQMLMFLTRMGRGSKMIITGDVTQVDLEKEKSSGLIDAINTLRGIKGIGVVELNESDIVRHKLVQDIVQAYDRKKKGR